MFSLPFSDQQYRLTGSDDWVYFSQSICYSLIRYLCYMQERIRTGKELLEAKRMAEESERKRFAFSLHVQFSDVRLLYFWFLSYFFHLPGVGFRLLSQRKADKEEEKRARERIRQKLQQDKVHPNYCMPSSLQLTKSRFYQFVAL